MASTYIDLPVSAVEPVEVVVNLDDEITIRGVDPNGVNRIYRISEQGHNSINGIYDAILNSDPSNIGLAAQERNVAAADSRQTMRPTAVRGAANIDTVALDVSLHDEDGDAYSSANPLAVANPNLDVPLSTRASESTLATRASETTLLTRASEATLATRASETTLAARLSEADFDSKIGALTEAAPATDTASSGLNGRLQRIAQRLTSLIGLLPTSLGQKAAANSFAVVMASDQPSIPVAASPQRGALTDRSGAATTTSAEIVPANSNRNYFFIQNHSGGTIWINFGVAAVTTRPSIRLQNGDSYSMEGSFISTQAIHAIAASGTRDFTAKEG